MLKWSQICKFISNSIEEFLPNYFIVVTSGEWHRVGSGGVLACKILVPLPGMEPRPPAVRVHSPNHWIVREFPRWCFIFYSTYFFNIWILYKSIIFWYFYNKFFNLNFNTLKELNRIKKRKRAIGRSLVTHKKAGSVAEWWCRDEQRSGVKSGVSSGRSSLPTCQMEDRSQRKEESGAAAEALRGAPGRDQGRIRWNKWREYI